jgi:hypothetical protein
MYHPAYRKGQPRPADLTRPWGEDVRDRFVTVFRQGLHVDLDLGDLRMLRELAAQEQA